MAWNVVQSASGTGAGVTSLTVTYASNVASGTKLVAYAGDSNSSGTSLITSIQDAALNTFTDCGTVSGTAGGGSDTTLRAMDTPAGDVGTKPAIKISLSSTNDIGMVIQEVSGLATGNTTAAMLDGSAATVQELPTTSQAQPAYTSHAANELLYSILTDNGNSVTWALSGYTLDTQSVQGSALNDAVVGYKNSTNGAESGSWTTSGTPTGSGLIVVAFKLAAAAAPFQLPQWNRRKVQVLQPPMRAGIAAPALRQLPPVPRRPLARAYWRGLAVPPQTVQAPRQPPYLPARRKLARTWWRGSAPFTGFAAVPAPIQQFRTAPRRVPGRALWRGGAGQAFVFVPAPVQEFRLAPRRIPARAVWAGSKPFTGFVQVPAPRQPPYLPPRRVPSRAWWRGLAVPPQAGQAPRQFPYLPPRRRPARAVVVFTPVSTSNAIAVAVAAPRQLITIPRRKLARAYVQFRAVATVNAPFVPRGQQLPAPDDKPYIKKLYYLLG
jgi:hypothetical protein